MIRDIARTGRFSTGVLAALAAIACALTSGDRQPIAAEPLPPASGAKPSPAWAALDQRLDFVVADKPLGEALEILSKAAGIPISLDRKAFADYGLDPDASISLELKGRRLKSILAHLAAETGGEWMEREGEIVFSSPQGLVEHQTTRVYPVGDLVGGSAGSEGQDFDSLTDVITSTVAPTTWDTVGGPGATDSWGSLLIVTQTHDVHDEIESLLAALRRSQASYQKWSGRDHRVPGLPLCSAWTPHEDEVAAWEAARREPITLAFEKTPLTDVAKVLREKTGLPFWLDRRSLVDLEARERTPITYSCREKPLDDAVQEMLSLHIIRVEPWYESIRIVAYAKPRKGRDDTWVFPIFDLDTCDTATTDTLIDELKASVPEDSWDTNGGPGDCELHYSARAIVVCQSADNLRKIAAFLAERRKTAPVAAKRAEAAPEEEWVTSSYPGLAFPVLADNSLFQRGDDYSRVIRAFIEPQSWDQPGSQARIEVDRSRPAETPAFGGGLNEIPNEQLIFTHRPRVVRRIRQLISELDSSFDGFVAVPEQAAPAPAEKPSPIEQIWNELAQRRVEIESIETPLKDITADLARQAKVTISFDQEALEKSLFSEDSPFSIRVKRMSFPAAMDHLLRWAKLGWRIRGKEVVVTSPEGAADSQYAKSYRVDDLVGPPGVHDPANQMELLVCLASSSIPLGSEAGEIGTRIQVLSDRAPVVTETPHGHVHFAHFLEAARRSRQAMLKWNGVDRPAPGLPAEGYWLAPDPIHAPWRKARRKPITLEFDKVALNSAILQMETLAGFPILLDERGLQDAGIDPAFPATLSCRDLPLESALRQILAPHELQLLPWNEAIFITTREEATNRVSTRLFPVFDLGWDSSDSLCRRESGDGHLPDLAQLVESTIAPPSWDSAGGAGHLEYLPRAGALVVTQSPEAHEAIARLLADIRRHTASPRDLKPATIAESWGTRVHRLPTKRRGPIPDEQIAARIRAEIAPASWGDAETQGKLLLLGDRLVVRQSMRAQSQIADYLRSLEASRKIENATPTTPAVETKP